MKTNPFLNRFGRYRPYIAAVFSLLIVAAFYSFMASVGFSGIFNRSETPGLAILAIVCGWLACLPLTVINTGSLIKGGWAAVYCLIAGILFDYFFIAGLGGALVSFLYRNSLSLPYFLLSTSLGIAFLLLAVISAVEFFTDALIRRKLLRRYLVTVILVLIVVYAVEYLTFRLGPINTVDFWRMVILAPFIWGTMTYSLSRH